MSTVPTYADTLPTFPRLHAITHKIDDSNDFMSRHTRLLDPWEQSFFHYRIAVANATRIDFHPHPARLWLRNIAFNDLKRSFRPRDLHDTHFFRHDSSIVLPSQKRKTCSGGLPAAPKCREGG